MATAAVRLPHTTADEYEHSGLWSWLTTVDHKRIGALYMYTALAWFAVGGLEALIMRWQLKGPNGHVVSAEVFNQLFTAQR
jgi:cytochrome c oxidase subunit 1